MNKIRRISLLIILPAIFLSIFFVFQTIIFIQDFRQSQDQLYVEAEQDIKGLAGQLQTSLSNALMRLEKARAQDFVSTAALNENVQTVAVIDKNQQIILSNNFREKYMFSKLQLERYEGAVLNRVINDNEIVVKYFKQSKELVVYAPLQMISKGNSLNRKFNGIIFIRYSLESAYSELTHSKLIELIKQCALLLLTVSLSVYSLNSLVIVPLKSLVTQMRNYDLTNLSELTDKGVGEIGFLQRTFSELIVSVSDNMNELAGSEQRLLYALRGARDGVWDWDIKRDHVFFSNRWKEILGYQPEDINADITEWETRIHDDDLYNVFNDFCEHFVGRDSFFENSHRIRCKNGEYRWVLTRGQTVSWDSKGNPLRVIGTMIDVSAYKVLHTSIKYQTQYDEVTELPNRSGLIAHISDENIRQENNGLFGALILIDAQQFSAINELDGNHKGDQLLSLIARRLETHISVPDYVARLRGCEFVIVLSDLHSDREQAAQISIRFAEQVALTLKQPFNLMSEKLTLKFAYGITHFPSEGLQAEDVLRQASMAMKTAQANPLNNISFFAKEIEEKINRTHQLQSKIRQGLDNNEFTLCFQPRTDSNNKLVGAEALCRWYQGDNTWVEPAHFIPVAEESDLIIPLGEWVLLNAFTQLKDWVDAGLPQSFKTLSLNVSPKQLLQDNFIETIELYLLQTGVEPSLIEIEITETVLVSHTDLIINKLHKLCGLGFRFAIDDFGTGYSSFQYLSILPVSALKIDQSFIVNLMQQHSQQLIVTAIINMGKSLNLEVVAEGVETQQQLDFLIEKGCSQFQGYLVSAPLTTIDFQKLLNNMKQKENKFENSTIKLEKPNS
ncbi:putative bifunctional diguanylate cyclase/phosphodiesterase [Psychromonas arctica]|uniref:putative bifunctional diguanylate cyclase/phosphodiesterase n=1 Tax=Psychromonas arctica TaxID=168275 RepID=UPI0004069B88|nr:bifunctional diguanylate cyclase/phosphodiesterase [Psychromonas arctica]